MTNTTPTEITLTPDKVMDVRNIPCSIKHGAIVRTFQELPVGDYFILLNDHNPVRLRDQFAAQWPDTFAWQYFEQGPNDFRVKITKLAALPAGSVPPSGACQH